MKSLEAASADTWRLSANFACHAKTK